MPTTNSAAIDSRLESRRRVTLRSPDGHCEFFCRPDEPILYAGLRHGLNLPYECATGTCGMCRLRGAADDGRLLWAEAPGHVKLKAGRDLLLCQTAAVRDCAVESPAALPPWPSGLPHPDHYVGRLAARRLLTGDVLAFTIALDRPMVFEPGQFVVLRWPAVAGYRAYTMIKADVPAVELSFVIKRKPDGGGSRWLFDGDGQSGVVEVFGPLGRATLRPGEEANLLLIAGSTGIAGPLAILRRAAVGGLLPQRRADVVFGVRTLADAFLLQPLAELAQRWPERLAVTLALSDEPVATAHHPTYPAVRLVSGRVDTAIQQTIDSPLADTIAFIGGPPPMVDASIRLLLRSRCVPVSRIRFDRFW